MELKETAVYYLESVDGLEAISFVDNPATQIEWFAFSDEKPMKFEKNEMERIVTGPIMLAETPMWRSGLNAYVKFSAEEIKNMAKKTFIKGDFKFNENHDKNKLINGVHLVESYFIGDRVESKLFKDLPEGTWMGSFYIEDEDYWNDVIMSDKFKGFSLEGDFKPVLDEMVVEQRFSDIEMILKSDLSDDVKHDSIKSLLFACPPKGDGLRKDGQPDRRCGDPNKQKGSGSGRSKAQKVDQAKIKDAVDNGGKLESTQEVTEALNYMETSSSNSRVKVDADVLDSYVNDIEKNLPKNYTETNEKLIGGGSGPDSFLKEKYGPDYKDKKIYKKDIISTNDFGDKILWKDAPFIKSGNDFIRVDSRDISRNNRVGHKDFNKPVFTVNRERGTIFSHAASNRLNQ